MAEVDYEKFKLKTYQYWTVYLHDKQNYLGRCYVVLNRSGNLDPFFDTTPDEREELESIVTEIKDVLTELYRPNFFNYANFRNTWPRCHWHIIPRYETIRTIDSQEFIDRNWGKNYAPYDRSFKISEELFWKIREMIGQGLMT